MENGRYNIGTGFADEITLSNGKKYYTGVNSINSANAKELGLKVKMVRFEGCCIDCNIMSRAKDNHYFPIEIDGVDIYSYIDDVADDDEKII